MIDRTNIFVTYKCNWHCSYCITNTHNQPDIDFDSVISKVLSLENNSKVGLSGGEPGLVPIDNLNKLFDIMTSKNMDIRVYTNGGFFKHTHLLNKVNLFIYHCSENLTNYVEKVHINNISYNIVVSESNYKNLESFMQLNSHIRFSVSGADNIDVLNKISGIKIWTKYKDKIYPSSKYYLMNHHKVTDKLTDKYTDKCTDECTESYK